MKITLTILLLLVSPFTLATPLCDETLTPINNDLIAYKERDAQRCEGFYRAKVSSGSLDIVSLTHAPLDSSLTEKKTISLSAPLSSRPVNVRGVGIKLKTYYRLDGVIPANGALNWPLGDVVFRSKALKVKDIGLYGLGTEQGETLYYPIKFGQDGDITLRFRSSVKVSSVVWRTAEAQQTECGDLGDWRDLKLSRTGRGRSIFSVPLSDSATGRLCVEVAAKEKGTGNWFTKQALIQVSQ